MGGVLLAANHDNRVSSRDQVAGSADGSYRPQLFYEAFAASSARIRCASEVVRILPP